MHEDWKSEYDTCLLNGDLNSATRIKNNNINRRFFKYRCFDEKRHWVDWIKETIFINSPKTFNDPFDCMINISPEATKQMLEEAVIKYLEQTVKLRKIDYNRLKVTDDIIEATCIILEQHGVKIDRELVNRNLFNAEPFKKKYDPFLRDILKVSCFSETNNSILMWSHYTNNHQGFCIEYDFSNDKDITNLLYPVSYSMKRYIMTSQDTNNNKWFIPTVLCKSPEWAYEQEWRYINAINPERFVRTSIGNEPAILSVPNTIKAIYLGAEFTKYHGDCLPEIKILTQSQNIDLYEMIFHEQEYKLIPNIIT